MKQSALLLTLGVLVLLGVGALAFWRRFVHRGRPAAR
jgi:LPXTG-motif cell wall-anchored protein